MNRTQLVSVLVAALFGSYALAVALIGGFDVVNGMERTQVAEQVPVNDDVFVPVAVRDIPVWTKFTKDNTSDYFVLKRFSHAAVPANAVLTLEDLVGRWVVREIHQGAAVGPYDTNSNSSIDPPEGTEVVTIHVAADPSAVGFILPGYKVTAAVAKQSESKGKEVILPMANDILILSVAGGGTPADRVNVMVALTQKQRDLLAPALEDGVTLRIILPRHDEGMGYETEGELVLKPARSVEEVRAFLAAE